MSKPLRARPAILRALGRKEPPPRVVVGGEPCELEELFKHDSWAATALYRGATERFVVKFNRTQPILFVPMVWLGRWLAKREARACRLLAGLAGIPPVAGEVTVEGRSMPTAFAHVYVPGRPLAMDDHPDEQFFEELKSLLAAMHARGMAYVDLNKRENIVITEDSRPLLVDWQLHFAMSRRLGWLPGMRWLLRELKIADRYHLQKHLLWHRPDLVPEGERNLTAYQPVSVRLWRVLYVVPVQYCRRRLLVCLGIRGGRGRAVSELVPEKAARLALERKAQDPSARLPGED